MKICNRCGNPVDDNLNFCPRCGSNLNMMNVSLIGMKSQSLNGYGPTQSNGFAIAGFVLSFFSGLLGLIFGAIGLSKSHYTNSGRGLSIAAIWLSIISIIIEIAVIVIYILIVQGVIKVNQINI